MRWLRPQPLAPEILWGEQPEEEEQAVPAGHQGKPCPRGLERSPLPLELHKEA